MSLDEYSFLSKKDFFDLPPKKQWNYITSIKKMLEDYKIQADKNCEECEYKIMTEKDLNIDMFFEDWRECANDCENCSKERLVNMCQTQMDLMNHIANSLFALEKKHTQLTKFVFKRDTDGKKILKKLKKSVKKKSAVDSYFQ